MRTRWGESEGRRVHVSDEAGNEAPVRDTDGTTSSDGRDRVQRAAAGFEERLDPVPNDALEWNIERGLWKARSLLPRKVPPGVFNPYQAAARVVVEHLERCGVRCFRKPPPPLPRAQGGKLGEAYGNTGDGAE